MLRRFVVNYLARHRNWTNRLLHLIGIPVTFIVTAVLLACGQWLPAIVSFVIGYALQFLGHWVEGNDSGEVVLIKRWLSRPYVEFGPEPKRSRRDG
ncbi:MAG: DUF962 domain-containing protein [Planctomycetaceae bacterium]